MNKKALIGVILIFSMLISLTVYADSPITSTRFSDTYLDFDIVQKAKNSGVMDNEIAQYLSSPNNPIDVKAAVINALGWNIDGKDNAEKYTNFIYKKSVEELNVSELNGNDSFCIGYLLALDNYFEPENAIPLLENANKALSKSLTVSLITAVVKSQSALHLGKTYTVWGGIKQVLDNKELNYDMRPGAIKIITDYVQSYSKYFELDTATLTVEKGKSISTKFIGDNGPYKLMGVKVLKSNSDFMYMGPKPNSTLFSPSASVDIKITDNVVTIKGINAGTVLATFSSSNNVTVSYPIVITLPPLKARLSDAVVLYIGSSNAYINNTKTKIDNNDPSIKPVVINNRTLVPIRFISEKLGANVEWDSISETATINISGRTIKITTSSNKMNVDNQDVTLDVPAETINGRLFIPLRKFVEEGLNKKVFFDKDIIIISDDENIIDKNLESNVINDLANILS